MVECPYCQSSGIDLGWDRFICLFCGAVFKGSFTYSIDRYVELGIHSQPEIHGLNKHYAEDLRRVLGLREYYIDPFTVVLDIGCDRGEFLDVLDMAGAHTIGCDVEYRMGTARKFYWTITDIQGKVDIVSCVHTIEHFDVDLLNQLSGKVQELSPAYAYVVTNSHCPIETALNDLRFDEHCAIPTSRALDFLFAPDYSVIDVNHRVDYSSSYLLGKKE